jgi:hypothetical protein
MRALSFALAVVAGLSLPLVAYAGEDGRSHVKKN